MPEIPAPTPRTDPRTVEAPAAQAQVLVAYLGPSSTDADYAAVRVLTAVLGGGMSSRLFIELRERRGLAYSVSALSSYRTGPGYLLTYLGTAPANATTAVSGVLGEIARVRAEPVSEREVERAKASDIAVGALKYFMLRYNPQTEIAFDFDESISLEGNSGPYLLYTFVRTQSVLNKSTYHLGTTWINNGIAKLEKEERDLLRTLANYSETVYEAARNFSPNLIANYLYDLAQKYNLFYQKHKILLTEEKIRIFRLLLTKATGQVIKNGLYLLGIKTVNKM